MKSYREENYLKAIYQISQAEKEAIVTITEIAHVLDVKPPSVLEKLNILVRKGLVTYNKVDGAVLTKTGRELAINIVRRHRIWETYLFKQLKFSWSEVHEIAEQLEHVNSDKLIDKIYEVIGKPNFDPHGDPIPGKNGVIPKAFRRPIGESVKGCKCVVLGVGAHNDEFLEHLTSLGIRLNDKLTVEKLVEFDGSVLVRNKDKEQIYLSDKVAGNLFVSCLREGCECKK